LFLDGFLNFPITSYEYGFHVALFFARKEYLPQFIPVLLLCLRARFISASFRLIEGAAFTSLSAVKWQKQFKVKGYYLQLY